MKPYIKVKRVFALCLMIGAVILFGAGEYIQYVNVKTISKKDALGDYDYMWEVLEGNYPFLKMAERKTGLSMDALKKTYREKIEEVGTKRIDFYDYYELMRECSGKFRGLAHLAIYNPYMYQNMVAEAEAMDQMDFSNDLLQWMLQFYHDPLVRKRYDYLARKYGADKITRNEDSAPNLTFQEISTDIVYVKINSFAAGNMLEDKDILSNWFSENAHKKNIIIDITGNGGGSDLYWMNLLVAPNIEETLSYTSYYITPYGEESREQFELCGVGIDDLNPNLEDLLKLPQLNREDLSEVKYYKPNVISVSPASDKKVCDGRFFLLTDRGVYSAADGFAGFCKATGFATVVGENTGGDGGGGNVFNIKLPQSSLIMKFRAMHGLNPDGSSNVEFGTAPDVAYSGRRGTNDVSFLGLCLDYIKSIE